MAKPKIPNQKNKYNELNNRLAGYVALVRQIYDVLNLEAAKMAERVGYNGEKAFRFKDYPQLKESVSKIQKRFISDMQTLVYSGISNEWKESNLVQDLMADKVLKAYGATVSGEKYKIYYRDNTDALKAFKERKDRGMNLSTKLWNQSADYKDELEYAISSALEKGTSAVTLSKRISKYLQNFDTLQKDYKAKFGKAVKCKDCQYASVRLARSEINMAYRTAEQKRWEQMDFVVGYEIKLSHAHHNRMPHGDICDDLAGKYPKGFKWTGWHPNDMCYVIPILKTEEEFWADDDVKSKNEVTDTPQQFKDWVSENKERIKKAKARGTLPYFVKNNEIYFQAAKGRLNKKISSYETILESLNTPFKLNNPTYDRLISEQGFDVFDVNKFNSSAISGFDILSFDKALEGICDANGIKIVQKKISFFGKKNINANLLYLGEYNGNLFSLERSFINVEDEKIVRHLKFVLPDDLQGNGISKAVMRELFKQYQQMGVKRVELYANLSVGGYCWAKYGFSAKKFDIINIVETAFTEKRIDRTIYDKAIDYIEKFENEIPMIGLAKTDYGKKLLLNTEWDGFINLTDAKAMEQFYDYLNG